MGREAEEFTVDPEMERLSKIRNDKPEYYKTLTPFEKLSLGYYLRTKERAFASKTTKTAEGEYK